jgi:hypothetical protein
MTARENVVGKTFNFLTVLEDLPNIRGKIRIVEAECKCGSVKKYRLANLRSNHTKACGCLYIKHNKSKTPEFKAWDSLKARCLNTRHKQYKDYGGRGISIHPEFLGENGFINFFKEVGERPSRFHSIDRENNNGNYEPGNLRWATKKEQSLNQRTRKGKKYRGVRKISSGFISSIFLNKKQIYIGTFKNEFEAVEAYLEKYYNHHKKFPPEYKPVKFKENFL